MNSKINKKIDKKILIVEDDKDFMFILQTNFRDEGFFIVTAQNGQEGLETAEKEKPDLILLDIMMPVMDGIEMAKRMRLKHINIPTIFLTNMSDVNHINKAIEVAPSEYIIKSDVSIESIIAEVKKKLGV
ncbi:MAG: response regulator [Candidatus Staskawiczbacteria bacterium]|nr:response regulator [Candidatus Staskawiczbacteria bacterium]